MKSFFKKVLTIVPFGCIINTDKTNREQPKGEIDMTQNIIYTDSEYMAQGFTAQEVPKVRRHDELFNKGEDRTEEETMEMVVIQKELGL